jgi:hypothetical protein
MNDAADVIRAIADLLWPAIVLVLLWVYRPEVVGMLRRLRVFASTPTPSDDPVDRLERLAKLKADGILTEEEFDAQKRRILGGK